MRKLQRLVLLFCSLFIIDFTGAINDAQKLEKGIQRHMDVLKQDLEIFTTKAVEFFPKHYIVYLLGMEEHFSDKFIEKSGIFMISYRNESGGEYQIGTGKLLRFSTGEIGCIFNGQALSSNSVGQYIAVNGYKKIMQRHNSNEKGSAVNRPQ